MNPFAIIFLLSATLSAACAGEEGFIDDEALSDNGFYPESFQSLGHINLSEYKGKGRTELEIKPNIANGTTLIFDLVQDDDPELRYKGLLGLKITRRTQSNCGDVYDMSQSPCFPGPSSKTVLIPFHHFIANNTEDLVPMPNECMGGENCSVTQYTNYDLFTDPIDSDIGPAAIVDGTDLEANLHRVMFYVEDNRYIPEIVLIED